MIQARRKLIKSGKAIVAVLSNVVRLIYFIVHKTNKVYIKSGKAMALPAAPLPTAM